jgi:hypothetical protein
MQTAPVAPWDVEEDGTFEVVEELFFDEVVDEGPAPAKIDGFAMLIAAMEEVAASSGAGPEAVRALRAVMGVERIENAESVENVENVERTEILAGEVRAWKSVLQGESDDLSGCGPLPLDEWCANVVARVIGAPARAEGLRRAMRQRGVAAFGLMKDAAA